MVALRPGLGVSSLTSSLTLTLTPQLCCPIFFTLMRRFIKVQKPMAGGVVEEVEGVSIVYWN